MTAEWDPDATEYDASAACDAHNAHRDLWNATLRAIASPLPAAPTEEPTPHA